MFRFKNYRKLKYYEVLKRIGKKHSVFWQKKNRLVEKDPKAEALYMQLKKQAPIDLAPQPASVQLQISTPQLKLVPVAQQSNKKKNKRRKA